MRAEFLGHACWYIESEGVRAIFDPFLRDNPQASRQPEDIHVDYVFVTHGGEGHTDHDADAVEIAKRNRALIVTTTELGMRYAQQGARVHRMQVGGKKGFPFGHVRFVAALHGTGVAGGHAAGIVANLFGKTFYHAGDTGLFSDLKLLDGVIEPRIDLAALPIGGNFTMNVEDAALAARWIRPKVVMPMHYDTWPAIRADADDFKRRVETGSDIEVRVLKPGETTEV